ncbi:MAG: DUF1559 domain-containing protein, partial [Planctomycetaceae bacterium]
ERLLVSTEATAAPNNTATLARTSLAVFNCPDDLESDAPGNISYVTNGGYILAPSWNVLDATPTDAADIHQLNQYGWGFAPIAGSTEAVNLTFATGVFWRESGSLGKRTTLDFISRGDGQSNTLMLSENLNARAYVSPGDGGWASRIVGDLAFLVPGANASATQFNTIDVSTSGIGMPAASGKAFALALRNGAATYVLPAGPPDASINGALNSSTDGAAPRPSSLHPGIVNAIFCDGSGKTISQTIADNVYAGLLSPNGGDFGQDILGSGSF